ncbi:hypothetical protein H9638_14210 [Arthrobacter sp. Sa2BUA2]|uniref:Uncharacterized protein n=1 Tax=Arthrobacter pullicola TaxID=2762224 RepID=A0ABR8YL94_9MICC|nr:hypothetical protein [Arthrobacter pullicola]MBD8044961.1 hypothetical protein [Arthrobacter pullicola]
MKKKLLVLACSTAVLAAVAGCGSGGTPSVSSSPTATQSSPASPEATAPQSQSPSPSESPAIAEGFPENLIPLFAGSTPTATSFAEDGKLLTASLTASSAAAPEEIAAFYTRHFEALGFAALEGDAVDSTSTKDFARTTGAETETANVSMVIREGQTVYTVGANVLPESAE